MPRKSLLALALLLLVGAAPVRPAGAQDPAPGWAAVLEAARGDTVAFDAWGGSPNINAYLEWAGGRLQAEYGVTLTHVKLDDTASAVSRILAEKSAGVTEGGSVDLIWINGENFSAMKAAGLLGAPFADALPNARLLDQSNPSLRADFTVPTEGLESPWGGAKLVFFADTARTGPIEAMPRSAAELLDWAKAHPGLFAYPAPPDFTGTTFLKQVLLEVTPDPAVLSKPVEEADFTAATAPLWAYLDALKPVSWREGRDYPENYPAMKQGLADGELGLVFAFNPAEASSAIAGGELPDTVRSFTFEKGTLGNTHFVAIPFNAASREAAMVVANFLISPEAQARKEDPAFWGDPTVLDMEKLGPEDRAAFAAIDRGVATLSPEALGPVLPEPHPSWVARLEEEWTKRYGS